MMPCKRTTESIIHQISFTAMRKLTIFVFCGALLLAASCQKKQASFETDDIKMTDANHLVVNDDAKFSGEVWDEAHRMCIELKDGKKTEMRITHANGQTAAIYKFDATEKTEQSHFYDENGKEISQTEFGKKYRKMISELDIQ